MKGSAVRRPILPDVIRVKFQGPALASFAAAMLLTTIGVRGQVAARPDVEGLWNGSTLTPLQRPDGFADRAAFTPAEAEEYVRTSPERARRRLLTDADRATQVDLDSTFVEVEAIPLDGLRTSLLVDPPDGRLPPMVAAAFERIGRRPKRSFDDPERMSLSERCLLGNFGLGGSLASPPLLPSEVIPSYYRIVQTDAAVLIFTEWIHDARVVRMNASHLPATMQRWLGDSVGRYEDGSLVVDTTDFRPDTHILDSGERLHVVERFTPVDAATLRYRVTVEDPDTWPGTWTAEWPFHAIDIRMFPVDCHEGNYSMENTLKGARAEEREKRPR